MMFKNPSKSLISLSKLWAKVASCFDVNFRALNSTRLVDLFWDLYFFFINNWSSDPTDQRFLASESHQAPGFTFLHKLPKALYPKVKMKLNSKMLSSK